MKFEVALPAIKVGMKSAMFRKSTPKVKYKYLDGFMYSTLNSDNWMKLKGNCYLTIDDILAEDWEVINILD